MQLARKLTLQHSAWAHCGWTHFLLVGINAKLGGWSRTHKLGVWSRITLTFTTRVVIFITAVSIASTHFTAVTFTTKHNFYVLKERLLHLNVPWFTCRFHNLLQMTNFLLMSIMQLRTSLEWNFIKITNKVATSVKYAYGCLETSRVFLHITWLSKKRCLVRNIYPTRKCVKQLTCWNN